MDRPNYSDPIVIPFTLTIPDPRPRRPSGRWDHDLPRYPGPGARWASPGGNVPPVLLAQFPAAMGEAAPLTANPGPDAQEGRQFQEAIARAWRRLGTSASEAMHGAMGDAAGHLLLNDPYPDEVETGLGPFVVHTEPTEPPAEEPPKGEAELRQATKQAQRYYEARRADALDERHLQAAEADRCGEPILKT